MKEDQRMITNRYHQRFVWSKTDSDMNSVLLIESTFVALLRVGFKVAHVDTVHLNGNLSIHMNHINVSIVSIIHLDR